MSADILIVDDEADIRNLIQGILEDEGYHIRQAANDRQAFEEIKVRAPQLMILDIWLQNSDNDGMEILEKVKADHPNLPILMISGHGTIETAVSAIKKGAYDFIEKPFKSDRLILMIERALETAKLRLENEQLRSRTSDKVEFVGETPVVLSLRQAMDRVAMTNSRVLLTGEAGTGKDVAARYIHKKSSRADGPFVALNCATLSPDRLEIELFGVAQDNPYGDKPCEGLLEKAHGGTLLLDEVADMPLETQGKILRVLQEEKFKRLGGKEMLDADIRILASTNRNLQELMEEGKFRQDLYYRLSVVPLEMPPLRDRSQDIKVLTDYFIGLHSQVSGLPVCTLDDGTYAALQAYDWPGNVRQLKNAIEWVMIMGGNADGKAIQPSQLPPEISGLSSNEKNSSSGQENFLGLPLREAREIFERKYLETQVKRFGGNISQTAQFVGMERSALHRKLKQLGLTFLYGQNDSSSAKTSDRENRKRA